MRAPHRLEDADGGGGVPVEPIANVVGMRRGAILEEELTALQLPEGHQRGRPKRVVAVLVVPGRRRVPALGRRRHVTAVLGGRVRRDQLLARPNPEDGAVVRL